MAEPWWSVEIRASLAASEVLSQRPDLGRLATLLAAHGSSRLRAPEDVDTTLDRLAELADGIPSGSIDAWHRRLFVDAGFAGNGAAYHDPRNSFLPEVLDRRVGIPISLAVVGIEVAARTGLDAHGVGMPGHFLVALVDPDRPGGRVFVDAFHGGALLDEQGCAQLFDRLFGNRQEFDPVYLAPVGTEQILIRMIANLKANYARARHIDGLCDLARVRVLLPGVSLDERRELIRLLGATGQLSDAELALSDAVRAYPAARDVLQQERVRLDALSN